MWSSPFPFTSFSLHHLPLILPFDAVCLHIGSAVTKSTKSILVVWWENSVSEEECFLHLQGGKEGWKSAISFPKADGSWLL
jgi:hypothetical protein